MTSVAQGPARKLTLPLVAALLLAAVAAVHHEHGVTGPERSGSWLRPGTAVEHLATPCLACTLAQGPAAQSFQCLAWVVPRRAPSRLDAVRVVRADQLERDPSASRAPPPAV